MSNQTTTTLINELLSFTIEHFIANQTLNRDTIKKLNHQNMY